MRAARPLAGALVAAVLALSGCGSSGSAPKTPAPVPKAQIISQGDAICRDRNSKLEALTPPTDAKDVKAVATYLRTGSSIAGDAANKIDALGRPDVDAPLFTSFVDGQRQQITAVNKLADQAEGGDVAGVTRTLSGPNAIGVKIKADAKAFGFQVCSEG